MDSREAEALLLEQLARYKANSHAELALLIGHSECIELSGASGSAYQIEIDVFSDSRPGGVIRVMGSSTTAAFVPSFR
jgi:hypothetical protein